MALPPLRLVSFLGCSVAAIALGFFAFDQEGFENAFRLLGYPTIVILSAGYVAILAIDGRSVFPLWIRKRESQALILACVLASLFLYTREGGGFKVVFDEQMLSNVALSLHTDHLPVVRESSLIGVANYEFIDKRPLLFPFLLSLMHDILGYRVENAFYLNFVITACFLGLLYTSLKRIGNRTAGVYAVVLACFFPLIEQNSSGGGFEMLNLLMTLICAWHAMTFWEKGEEKDLAKLLLAAALASHVRYESALIILPVAGLVIASWWRERRVILPWIAIALPFAFLTLAWQLNYIRTQPMYWQHSLQGSFFSLEYLPINAYHAFRFLFIPIDSVAGSPFIAFAGVAGLLGLVGFSFTRTRKLYQDRPDRIAAVTIASSPILQFLLVLCFTFGQLDNLIVSRLGLPFVLLLFACGGVLLSLLHQRKKAARTVALCLVGLTTLYSFKMYSKAEYTLQNRIKPRIDWALDFADSLPYGTYLFISDMPRVFEIEGYNNLSIGIARDKGDQILKHLKIMTYDAVYVIQHGKIEIVDGEARKELLPSSTLGSAFELETIDERSFLALNFTRVSKLVGYDGSQENSLPEQQQSRDIDNAFINRMSAEELREWQRSLP